MIKQAVVACALVLTSPSWAINKCVGADGKISYQAAPCASSDSGKQLKLQPVPETSAEEAIFNSAVARGKVMTGMSAAQVRRSWGAPTKINSTLGSYGKHEQWIYDRGNYQAQYVYLQNGVVTSIQSPE